VFEIWESGFGAMCMNERRGGDLCWTLNLAAHGVGVVLISIVGHMVWGYGRTSRG
jgi:hypothetical protein